MMTPHTPPPNPQDLPQEGSVLAPPIPCAKGPGYRPSFWERHRDRIIEAHRGPAPKRYSLGEIASGWLAFWRQPAHIVQFLIFLLLVAYFFYQASIYWVAVIDDSYITFRFSDHLVRGHGLVFNEGGPRVEGFTNFLWMVSCAAAIAAGWDVMFFSKWLGLACAVGTIVTSWCFARRLTGNSSVFNLLPVALLCTSSHFAHWSLMGMETQMATFFVFATFARFQTEMTDHRAWLISPFTATLAAMTRIDSLYYLSPLGVYGLVLILQGSLRLSRMLWWSGFAAATFGAYFAWKVAYFGDIAPNTYYAKQRLVNVNPEKVRGKAHLYQFYMNQNGDNAEPLDFGSIPKDLPRRAALVRARLLYELRGGKANSLWWMNWWMGSLAVVVLFPRMRNWFLVLAPVGMNVYYVYHVDGDWMPNFRFFQVVLPFLAIAGAEAVQRLRESAAKRPGAIAAAAGCWLSLVLAGNALEQARVGYVYVFGRDPMWLPRGQNWSAPEEVRKAYTRGFSPPLGPVSDWMLLNTVDGGSIFMSDIGQPLWFASHLNLYDVDGLTDKHLAHAPSVRGNLKTPQEHYADILRERNIVSPTPAQEKQFRLEAQKRDFDAHLARNTDYILRQKRPEYLLIFLNHEGGDPNKRGWPYPEISARVYNDPARETEYTFLWREPKVANVWNTVFRRNDVPVTVPDEVKVERLRRTIERNPRLYYLVRLAYDEMVKMQPGPARDACRALVLENLPRLKANPETEAELVRRAVSGGDEEFASRILERALARSPNDLTLLRAKADAEWRRGNKEKAIEALEAVARQAPASDNGNHYTLTWYYEASGKPDKANEVSRQAIARNPRDKRAWTDLATVAARATFRSDLSPQRRLHFKRTSLEGWLGLQSIEGAATPKDVLDGIETLKAEIAELERELGIEPGAPIPPAPAPPAAPAGN
jgi:tetratricopeptide (TPR) repeat protein